jgi:ribosomal protein S18 acetylase RimI-like enzyme
MERIEAIERATLDAVPPQRLVQWREWLLPFDGGTVGRSHSAVPLRHDAPAQDVLQELERRYREAGLATVLRIPEVESFAPLREQLRAGGYVRAKPTLVQVGDLARLARGATPSVQVELATRPGAEWEAVFLGEGFDPVDGASRLAILRRGVHSLFAGIRVDGGIVAVGSACTVHGWCGVHGMRTLPAWRGRGCASAILAALARAGQERGITQVFLQVDASNAAARSLYESRGFSTAWSYAYWQRP